MYRQSVGVIQLYIIFFKHSFHYSEMCMGELLGMLTIPKRIKCIESIHHVIISYRNIGTQQLLFFIMNALIRRKMNTIIIQLSNVYLSGVTMWESIVCPTMTSWLIFQHSDLRECTRSAYYKIFIKTNYSTHQKLLL